MRGERERDAAACGSRPLPGIQEPSVPALPTGALPWGRCPQPGQDRSQDVGTQPGGKVLGAAPGEVGR